MRVFDIHDQQDSGFLQSNSWEEFQKSVGCKVWRIEGVLVVKYPLPLGKSYVYIPRCLLEDIDRWKKLIGEVSNIARREGAIFLRTDPALVDSAEHRALLQDLGFHKAPHEIQPKRTLIMDLTPSEEQLLAEMHTKTRYNIKLAERKGVRVEIPNPNFQSFWSLLQETAKRDGFRTRTRQYYEKLLKIGAGLNPSASPFVPLRGISRRETKWGSEGDFSREASVQLFMANYEGKTLATAIVAFFNNWALYLHGASSSEHRDLMAPHLLHWRIIQQAKAYGCTKYDLWGIDPVKWPGVTRFKQGFAPEVPVTSYVGAWDYPFQKWWYVCYMVSKRIFT